MPRSASFSIKPSILGARFARGANIDSHCRFSKSTGTLEKLVLIGPRPVQYNSNILNSCSCIVQLCHGRLCLRRKKDLSHLSASAVLQVCCKSTKQKTPMYVSDWARVLLENTYARTLNRARQSHSTLTPFRSQPSPRRWQGVAAAPTCGGSSTSVTPVG